VKTLSFPGPDGFYNQYRNNPVEARKKAFEVGAKMGRALKSRNNIQGEDLAAVAEILNAAMKAVHGEPSARAEENGVTMRNTGFCAIMRAALTLNLPWEWLDNNFAWPWLEGIVSVIRSGIRLRIPSARCRGDEACMHIFEVEQ
jgi:hypothetical protein